MRKVPCFPDSKKRTNDQQNKAAIGNRAQILMQIGNETRRRLEHFTHRGQFVVIQRARYVEHRL